MYIRCIHAESAPQYVPCLLHACTCMYSPVFLSSSQLLLSPRRITRKIPKAPFKVLDAPELQDDFYLNLLDWSSLNLLAVGLGSAVYLWNACTCQVSVSPSPSLQLLHVCLSLVSKVYLTSPGPSEIGHNSFISQPILKPLAPVDSS